MADTKEVIWTTAQTAYDWRSTTLGVRELLVVLMWLLMLDVAMPCGLLPTLLEASSLCAKGSSKVMSGCVKGKRENNGVSLRHRKHFNLCFVSTCGSCREAHVHVKL